jgi:tRNA A37 methylthiotransferase MiaB
MPKVYSITNGCEEGQLKSMHAKQFFLENGFTVAEDLAQADFVVFFSCGLTQPKETQSIQMIKKLESQKKDGAELIVWGCLPKINPRLVREVYNGPIVGPKDLEFFEKILSQRVKTLVPIYGVSANALVPQTNLGVPLLDRQLPYDPVSGFLKYLYRWADRVRLPKRKWLFDESSYFIRVSEGCTGNCTYCSERPAWGGVRSRSIETIAEEFRGGLERGQKRFFLVAADLGSYGVDLGCDAIDLLREILRSGQGKDFRLIINQTNPSDLLKLLPRLEEIFDSGKIEAIGCQVESGSNRILGLMNRRYTAESWRDSMLWINKKFPFMRLSTHIMIGFPGETDEDFRMTMKLLDLPIFVDWVGMFIFSRRPGVYASRFTGQVPEKIKQLRCRRLFRKYLFMYVLNIALGNLRYLRSKIKFA